MEEMGLLCPHPIDLKDNLIVMQFLGEKGKAYPRLIDVTMKIDEASECYLQVVRLMRTMYLKCNLVHADLSEYNLLYHDQKIYVIDVSQSVEESHPYSHEFLKRDVININNFFQRLKVNTFNCKQVFRFACDHTIPPESEEQFLENLMDETMEGENPDTEAEINEFLNMNIPRT